MIDASVVSVAFSAMPQPLPIIRIAELVKLAAETAKDCSEVAADGEMSRIVEIAQRIGATAEELEQAARELERDEQE